MQVALELLDYHYADEKVRSMAVERLEKLENYELQELLLQLVQVHMHVTLNDSPSFRYGKELTYIGMYMLLVSSHRY